MMILGLFFLFLHKNRIITKYSLTILDGALFSTEYHNIFFFCGEISNILCGYPLLSGTMHPVVITNHISTQIFRNINKDKS